MAKHEAVASVELDGPDWDPETARFIYPPHVKVSRPAAWRGRPRFEIRRPAWIYAAAPWVCFAIAGGIWTWLYRGIH